MSETVHNEPARRLSAYKYRRPMPAITRGRANEVLDTRISRPKDMPHKAWNPAQLATFLRHARPERLFAMWLLFATTGMRRSEAVCARREALDIAAGTLSLVVITAARTQISSGKDPPKQTPHLARRRYPGLPPRSPRDTRRGTSRMGAELSAQRVAVLLARRPADLQRHDHRTVRAPGHPGRPPDHPTARLPPHLRDHGPARRRQPADRQHPTGSRERPVHRYRSPGPLVRIDCDHNRTCEHLTTRHPTSSTTTSTWFDETAHRLRAKQASLQPLTSTAMAGTRAEEQSAPHTGRQV
jgi:integrase